MVGIMAPVQKARHGLHDRANNPDIVQWPALRDMYCILGRAQHLLVIDPYLGAVTSEPVSAGRQRQLKPAVIAGRGRKLLARRIARDDRPGQWQRRGGARQGWRGAGPHRVAGPPPPTTMPVPVWPSAGWPLQPARINTPAATPAATRQALFMSAWTPARPAWFRAMRGALRA